MKFKNTKSMNIIIVSIVDLTPLIIDVTFGISCLRGTLFNKESNDVQYPIIIESEIEKIAFNSYIFPTMDTKIKVSKVIHFFNSTDNSFFGIIKLKDVFMMYGKINSIIESKIAL